VLVRVCSIFHEYQPLINLFVITNEACMPSQTSMPVGFLFLQSVHLSKSVHRKVSTHCPNTGSIWSAWRRISSPLPLRVDTPRSILRWWCTCRSRRAPAPPGPSWTPTLTSPGTRGQQHGASEQHFHTQPTPRGSGPRRPNHTQPN